MSRKRKNNWGLRVGLDDKKNWSARWWGKQGAKERGARGRKWGKGVIRGEIRSCDLGRISDEFSEELEGVRGGEKGKG